MPGLNEVKSDIAFSGSVDFKQLPKGYVFPIPATATTIDVANLSTFVTQNVAPVTIDTILHGQNGQSIAILGDGNTTISVDAINKLLAADIVYRFMYINSVWYEED